MFSRAICPLGDERKCPGHPLKTKSGEINNDCAFCKKNKERVLATMTETPLKN